MKKIFKILGILMAFVMMFSVLPSMAAAQLENYDSSEVSQLQQFLNLPSGITGKTNGQVLNPAYNANDPETWTGVQWTTYNTPKSVWAIGAGGEWTGQSLAGDLDLSDFTYLGVLNIPGNLITSLNTTNDNQLYTVNCSDNRMTTVRYDYYGGYANFTSDGNGYVGYATDIKYKGEIRVIIIYGLPEAKPGYTFDTWQNYGELMVDDNVVRLYSYEHTYYPVVKALFTPDENPYPSYPPSITPPPPTPTPIPIPLPTPTQVPAPVQYTPKYYKVVFDPNGGLKTGGGELTQSVLEGFNADLPTVEYEDHNFVGWDSSNKVVTSNMTIKAVWEDIHQVTFDLNGGTKTGGGDLVQHIVNNEAATAPIVERYNYSFGGWNKSFDKITEDTTVYAIWERVPDVPEPVKYRVIYDINGGSGEAPVDTNEYDEGNVAVLSDNAGFSMEGFEFVGWSFVADGEVISEEEIIVSDDVTLYAIWEEAEVLEPEPEPTDEPTPVPDATPPIVEEETGDIPKTGDNSGVLIGALMLVFGSGIVAFETIRKRRIRKTQE